MVIDEKIYCNGLIWFKCEKWGRGSTQDIVLVTCCIKICYDLSFIDRR